MDNIEKLKIAIKENNYTMQGFAEEVLGIKRLALYRKMVGKHPFTKLEKEKIKELFNIEL